MVVGAYDGGFGGLWAATSLMLRTSELRGKPVYVAGDNLMPMAMAPFMRSNGSIQASFTRPKLLFIHPSHHEVYARLRGPLPKRLLRWRAAFALRYHPTVTPWRGAGSRRIAYQFIPGKEGPKSCKPEEIESFEPRVRALGFTPVALGAHLGIAGSIAQASNAGLFVGVCSGMSHLCHSVGLPVHLIRNDQPAATIAIMHKGNPYQLHENLGAFLHWLAPFADRCGDDGARLHTVDAVAD